MSTKILENSMAENGIEYISDALKHSAPTGYCYVGFMVTSDATIADIELEIPNTGNTMVGAVLPQGSYAFRARSITLTSGTLIAVKGA